MCRIRSDVMHARAASAACRELQRLPVPLKLVVYMDARRGRLPAAGLNFVPLLFVALKFRVVQFCLSSTAAMDSKAQTVVLDIGGDTCKIGFAGQSAPK